MEFYYILFTILISAQVVHLQRVAPGVPPQQYVSKIKMKLIKTLW